MGATKGHSDASSIVSARDIEIKSLVRSCRAKQTSSLSDTTVNSTSSSSRAMEVSLSEPPRKMQSLDRHSISTMGQAADANNPAATTICNVLPPFRIIHAEHSRIPQPSQGRLLGGRRRLSFVFGVT